MNTNIKVGTLLTEYSFEVLPFQRPCVWDSDKGFSLWENLWSRYDSCGENYYLGSLFAVETTDKTHFKIIDGQQRLIAITVMLCGIRDMICENRDKIRDQTLLEKLQFVPYIGGILGDVAASRLTVKPQDQEFFNNYILKGLPFEDYMYNELKAKGDTSKINLIENVKKFKEWYDFNDTDEVDVIGFTNFIFDKMFVTLISEKPEQSAHQIYTDVNANPFDESVNISLSESDQIKVILYNKMNLTDVVEEEYEPFWNHLEECCGVGNLDDFFTQHLSLQSTEELDDSISSKYKAILDGDKFNFLEFREKMWNSAENYQRIRDNKFNKISTQRAINSLNRVIHSEWKSPLLAFLKNPPNDGYDINNFVSDLEKITYQMWILERNEVQRKVVYSELTKKIVKSVKGSEIQGVFRRNNLNDKIGDAIDEANVYKNHGLAKAILLRLEEYDLDESVTKIFKEEDITIEHILPQNFSDKYWRSKFTKGYHSDWVHCLGNLVLLSGSKNSQAQDSDFARKKQVYNELNSRVSFDTTKSVLKHRDWNEKNLDARHNELVKKVIAIWSIDVD